MPMFMSFYHLSTLDDNHVRKCTRPSALYRTASDEKLDVELGTRLSIQWTGLLDWTVKL